MLSICSFTGTRRLVASGSHFLGFIAYIKNSSLALITDHRNSYQPENVLPNLLGGECSSMVREKCCTFHTETKVSYAFFDWCSWLWHLNLQTPGKRVYAFLLNHTRAWLGSLPANVAYGLHKTSSSRIIDLTWIRLNWVEFTDKDQECMNSAVYAMRLLCCKIFICWIKFLGLFSKWAVFCSIIKAL